MIFNFKNADTATNKKAIDGFHIETISLHLESGISIVVCQHQLKLFTS